LDGLEPTSARRQALLISKYDGHHCLVYILIIERKKSIRVCPFSNIKGKNKEKYNKKLSNTRQNTVKTRQNSKSEKNLKNIQNKIISTVKKKYEKAMKTILKKSI
jgi:CHAT domain-containing protein